VKTIVKAPERVGILAGASYILSHVEPVIAEGQTVTAQQLDDAEVVSWTDVTVNGSTLAKFRAIEIGSVLTQGMFKNNGPLPIRVTLATAEGDTLVTIASGDGFYVGSLLLAPPTHKKQCECKCNNGTVPMPTITFECPPASGSDSCPCGSSDGTKCDVSGGPRGIAEDCQTVLVPVASS
jgi:hypothetical protein